MDLLNSVVQCVTGALYSCVKAQIEAVLTAEQRAQLESIKAQRGGRGHARHGKRD